MPNLPKTIDNIIQEFVEEVKKVMGKRVKKIILYGVFIEKYMC